MAETRLDFRELGRVAREVRVTLAGQGLWDPCGFRRPATRPRDPEKAEFLYLRAMERLRRYPPRVEGGVLVLPYFLRRSRRRKR